MKLRNRGMLLLVTLVTIAGLSGFDLAGQHLQRAHMPDLSPRLKPMFNKTKEVCFGRFVVEVPATATVVYGPASIPFDIFRLAYEGSQLEKHVAETVAEINDPLQRRLADDVAESPLYGTVTKGAVPEQKIVFGHSQGSFHKITSFVRIGADLYSQRTTASLDDTEKMRAIGWTVPQRVASLNAIARQLRARADDEVPAVPGLCINGAFIADDPAITHERLTLGIRLKEFPDVHFSIEVNKNQGSVVDSNALEPRLGQARDRANSVGLGSWYARIRTLRRGERDIAQWKGFENLAFLPGREDMGAKHDFSYMALGSPTDPYVPMLDAEMSTGVADNKSGEVPPSLTDDEAVALWDKLTRSIRVRPTITKTSDATAPPRELGSLALTGDTCPRSGWWECTASRPVRGGNRQFFRNGDILPHAAWRGERSIWQVLKGEMLWHPVSTVWELVEYDVPDPLRPGASIAPP